MSAPAAPIWEMEAKTAKEGGNYTPLEAGTYPAVVIGLLDIGHHPETNDSGKGYWARKLVVLIELANLARENGDPYVYAKEYTWSLSNKAKFREVASLILGRTFADGDKFNPTAIVNMPCMAAITNSKGTSKKGEPRVYDNLGAIQGYPKGFPAPPFAKRDPVVWSVQEDTPFPDREWFPRMFGQLIAEKVEESREARGLAEDAPAPGGRATTRPDPDLPPAGTARRPEGIEDGDDVPY